MTVQATSDMPVYLLVISVNVNNTGCYTFLRSVQSKHYLLKALNVDCQYFQKEVTETSEKASPDFQDTY